MRLPVLIASLLTGLLIGSAAAAEPFLVTGTDFQTREVDVAALGPDGVTLTDGTTLPAGEVLRLDGARDVLGGAGEWRLRTRDGEVLLGEPLRVEGETLVFATTGGAGDGEREIELQRLASLAPRTARPVAAARGGDDLLTLRNGDVLRGLFVDLADGVVTMDVDGREAAVALGDVAALAVAPLGEPARRAGWLVTYGDGSVVFSETLPATDRMSGVLAAEQVNGPVTYLAALPFEERQVPYFSASAPARVGQDVTGGPIRHAGRTTRRGIGVHARSELTFELPEGYARLVARYALAGRLPRGDVTVRVLLDGEVALERENVTAGPAGEIDLPLEGARTLTLVVDYGEGLDVQDRLNWIDPAIVK